MQPHLPEWFEEALEREFQGRLRLRWSARRKEWHIEEQVGRGIFDVPKVVDPYDDRTIRARDGYRFVAAVQPKPSRPCPQCHLALDVPELAFREVRCAYCGFKGLSGRMVLAYFPLGEKLLEHMRRHDPLKGRTQQNVKEVDLHNERRTLGLERDNAAQRQDVLMEDLLATHFPTAGLPAKSADYLRSLNGR